MVRRRVSFSVFIYFLFYVLNGKIHPQPMAHCRKVTLVSQGSAATFRRQQTTGVPTPAFVEAPALHECLLWVGELGQVLRVITQASRPVKQARVRRLRFGVAIGARLARPWATRCADAACLLRSLKACHGRRWGRGGVAGHRPVRCVWN